MSALAAAVDSRLEAWTRDRVAERIWGRDASLWAASGAEPQAIVERLGWLSLPDEMSGRLRELEQLARDVRDDGYRRVAVLGMGGSSLAPELFGRVFGGGDGLQLRVLDSTHPDAVREFRDWATAGRTIYLVSSKSGTTTEPLAFHAAMAEVAPALDFIAITDPGTPLAELARSQGFRAVIEAPADVGGRYSALTVFGLVPAILAGVDVGRLLERARAMAERCRTRQAVDNPGLRLGALMGEAALAGRDKLTILTSERLESFGDWAEQLIAESTGKQGRGIVPVVGEPIGDVRCYGDDRCFISLTIADEPAGQWRQLADALERGGHLVEELELPGPYDVGAEFVRWELATAAAGIVLGIDPFDQPNVQEAKDATTTLLRAYRASGSLPEAMPLVSDDVIAVHADAAVLGDRPVSIGGALRSLFERADRHDYVAILAYVPAEPTTVAALSRVRTELRDALGVATTLGIGPRFLHSTGQLHKGGADNGVFIQITAEPRADLPIPGWQESFGVLVRAQALGDLASLQRRGRRAVRLHLSEVDSGLESLEAIVSEELATLAVA